MLSDAQESSPPRRLIVSEEDYEDIGARYFSYNQSNENFHNTELAMHEYFWVIPNRVGVIFVAH